MGRGTKHDRANHCHHHPQRPTAVITANVHALNPPTHPRINLVGSRFTRPPCINSVLFRASHGPSWDPVKVIPCAPQLCLLCCWRCDGPQ